MGAWLLRDAACAGSPSACAVCVLMAADVACGWLCVQDLLDFVLEHINDAEPLPLLLVSPPCPAPYLAARDHEDGTFDTLLL